MKLGMVHRSSVIGHRIASNARKWGVNAAEQITYDSLWIHARRHYSVDGVAAYWSKRLGNELRKSLKA